MANPVKTVCTLIARSRLLPPAEVKSLYQRWKAEVPRESRHDLRPFRKWLISHEYLTRFQAKLLLRGQTDAFFLHHFKILERAGKGRVAGVFKAVHRSGQVVAVKVLPPSRGKDTHYLTRFRREAEFGKRLKHPNVVRIFQRRSTKGLHYLVLEYLDGETLASVLERRRKLPPQEAVRLVYQAMIGLQHLHEKGLVHRDLEPGNLMLVPAPGEDGSTTPCTVKILDLGLARDVNDKASPGPDQSLTRQGELLGTAAYMAPEQGNDPHQVDIRADIYSLGSVLYHALTGQAPFPDESVLRQVLRHASETPRPLSVFLSDVPEGLQLVLDRLLAKKPEQRYATPKDAAAALEAVLMREKTALPTPTLQPHLDAFVKWLESDTNEEIPRPSRRVPNLRPRTNKKRATSAAAPAPLPAPQPLLTMSPPMSESLSFDRSEVEGRVGIVPQNSREWLMAGVGAGALLLIGGLVWLVRWLLQ